MSVDVQEELFVDTSRNEKMRINVDIDFPKMPCAYLSMDVMDVSGETQGVPSFNALRPTSPAPATCSTYVPVCPFAAQGSTSSTLTTTLSSSAWTCRASPLLRASRSKRSWAMRCVGVIDGSHWKVHRRLLAFLTCPPLFFPCPRLKGRNTR